MAEFFMVGGAVRDKIMGIRTKDIDFSVVAPSFEAMREAIVARGFSIFLETPEFVTIRAGIPEGDPLRALAKDADFVLARKDSATGDGRRPDFVEAGTLKDDIMRRDFTVNAIAIGADGEIMDFVGGVADIESGTLRFVGNPEDRIREDGLRVLRGFRFMVTKGLRPEAATRDAMFSPLATEMLGAVSVERIREEVERMMAADTLETLSLLRIMPNSMVEAIFRDGLRLSATLRS